MYKGTDKNIDHIRLPGNFFWEVRVDYRFYFKYN
jgi:hypothetical protein